jgi:uncharacterized protein (TIGR02145 family)
MRMENGKSHSFRIRQKLVAVGLLAMGLLSSCGGGSSTDSSGGGSKTVTYGALSDVRDGASYKTVTIGTQTWMAENLNYRNTTGSKDTFGTCYKLSADSCAKYGRLYTWMEAIDTGADFDDVTIKVTLPRQGICPTGWHVPSDTEWGTLVAFVGADDARIKLSSTTGWSTTICSIMGWKCSGTDDYGFRVLPGGGTDAADFLDTTVFIGAGTNGDFLSATQTGGFYMWERGFSSTALTTVSRYAVYKSWRWSLRCLKN